jgi:hypothetical protein
MARTTSDRQHLTQLVKQLPATVADTVMDLFERLRDSLSAATAAGKEAQQRLIMDQLSQLDGKAHSGRAPENAPTIVGGPPTKKQTQRGGHAADREQVLAELIAPLPPVLVGAVTNLLVAAKEAGKAEERRLVVQSMSLLEGKKLRGRAADKLAVTVNSQPPTSQRKPGKSWPCIVERCKRPGVKAYGLFCKEHFKEYMDRPKEREAILEAYRVRRLERLAREKRERRHAAKEAAAKR